MFYMHYFQFGLMIIVNLLIKRDFWKIKKTGDPILPPVELLFFSSCIKLCLKTSLSGYINWCA